MGSGPSEEGKVRSRLDGLLCKPWSKVMQAPQGSLLRGGNVCPDFLIRPHGPHRGLGAGPKDGAAAGRIEWIPLKAGAGRLGDRLLRNNRLLPKGHVWYKDGCLGSPGQRLLRSVG